MPVPRTGIPPMQAHLLDRRRLQQGCEQDESALLQQRGHRGHGLIGKGNVLHHLEAGDAIEGPRGQLLEVAEGIVGRAAKPFSRICCANSPDPPP